MMYCQDSWSALSNKLLKIDSKGIDTEPKLMFTKKQTMSIKINTKKGILYVLLFGNYSKGLKKYGV
jgi:hypothetical protein